MIRSVTQNRDTIRTVSFLIRCTPTSLIIILLHVVYRLITSTTRSLWTSWSSHTKASSPFWMKLASLLVKSRTRCAWTVWTPNWPNTPTTPPARWARIATSSAVSASALTYWLLPLDLWMKQSYPLYEAAAQDGTCKFRRNLWNCGFTFS